MAWFPVPTGVPAALARTRVAPTMAEAAGMPAVVAQHPATAVPAGEVAMAATARTVRSFVTTAAGAAGAAMVALRRLVPQAGAVAMEPRARLASSRDRPVRLWSMALRSSRVAAGRSGGREARAASVGMAVRADLVGRGAIPISPGGDQAMVETEVPRPRVPLVARGAPARSADAAAVVLWSMGPPARSSLNPAR